MSSAEPHTTRPSETFQAVDNLIDRCREVRDNVELVGGVRSAEKEAVLQRSLDDALQRLELVLRAIGEGAESVESHVRLQPIPTGEELDSELGRVESVYQGLQGCSWTVSLTELLSFLSHGRKTGVLWIDALDENYMLMLEAGRLVHATSDKAPTGSRLGEVLVSLGFLTRCDLEQFLSNDDEECTGVVGEELIKAGMISGEELVTALARQIQQLFYGLVTTTNAVFRFREGMEVMLAHKVSIDINGLLLQAAIAQDEMEADPLAALGPDA